MIPFCSCFISRLPKWLLDSHTNKIDRSPLQQLPHVENVCWCAGKNGWSGKGREREHGTTLAQSNPFLPHSLHYTMLHSIITRERARSTCLSELWGAEFSYHRPNNQNSLHAEIYIYYRVPWSPERSSLMPSPCESFNPSNLRHHSDRLNINRPNSSRFLPSFSSEIDTESLL